MGNLQKKKKKKGDEFVLLLMASEREMKVIEEGVKLIQTDPMSLVTRKTTQKLMDQPVMVRRGTYQ